MLRRWNVLKKFPVQKAHGKSAQDALDQLNAFLNASEPEPVYWLTRLWDDQQQAITYKELREAIERGYIDQSTLAAWQNDYANFVNEKLKPIWVDAMTASTAQLMAKHPDFFFDPMAEGVRNWMNTHGAEWVTQMSDEQRDAMAAMISHATTGAWTTDELARAMRPTIGLTKPQATANLKYFQNVKASLLQNNPTMKEATAAKRAEEAAHKYAAQQHRARAYTISTTELAYAYNKGQDEGVKQAIQLGYMGKTVRIWSTAADSGVCEICAALDGVEIGMEDEFSFKGKALYAGSKETPPAHPRCRCAVDYQEIEPPIIQPEPQAPLPAWGAQPPPIPDPQAPTIPQSLAVPDGMTSQGPAKLGGTGEMIQYKDGGGQPWLFKPAQSKSGTPEPFRAYVQEAGYKVQAIVDPDTAVPVGTGTLDGRLGAFQKRVDTLATAPNFKAWQSGTAPLPDGFTAQFQREHVTDWLLGNFDSHGGNFVVDNSGRLVGIDKEQAFKYIAKDGSKSMSYAFHPNKSYGEQEPIYNTIYRRFAKGEIDLNLQDTLTYIKRVEAIPDNEYREIFRSYAEALHGKGPEAEKLLDAIVERKAALRETYRSFYADLLTERTGKKQVFIWADEMQAHVKQPLAAVTHSPDVLKQMNMAELKQLAKQKAIPYYNNFSKPQLVQAISDPVKAVEISAQTKARLLSQRAARAANATPKPLLVPKGALGASDVFKDMSVIPAQRIGVPIYSDKGMVEGLNLTARRVSIDGSEVYELVGKLTESTWSATWDTLKGQSDIRQFVFEKADDTLALLSSRPINMGGVNIKARVLEDGDSKLELYVHNGAKQYNGWKGFFRLRVAATANGTADAKAARDMLERVGLVDLTSTPTTEAETIFKKTRLLWQNAPSRMSELSGLTGKDLTDKLDAMLTEEGLTKRVGNLVTRTVFDGYSTVVEQGISKEYSKAGLRYVWAGVSNDDAVVSILQGKGFMSTNTRSLAGMDFTGASPESDMGTGGSDSVFTRIGVKMKKGSQPRFDNCYMGGGYRIIISPEVMERTDWYAYDHDNYGTISDLASRSTPLDFIKSMATKYRSGNEIMFRRGIPKEQFTGIVCPSDVKRTQLLGKLKKAGITEVNGVPVKDFVKVGDEI